MCSNSEGSGTILCGEGVRTAKMLIQPPPLNFHSLVMSVYAKTTLGVALTTTLDEMKQRHLVSDELSEKVMRQFELSLREAFAEKVSSHPVKFRYKVDSYRFFENMWNFTLTNANFHLGAESVQSDRLTVVAIDDEKVASYLSQQ